VVVTDLSPAHVVTDERRARWLLALGAATGLAIAAASLVSGTRRDVPPPDAIATVNDAVIRRDDYLRALAGIASDRRTPPDASDKRHVLDRLIDEELLLQRGIALGVARRDRTVRAQLVTATMELLASTTAEASPDELRAFYDAHPDYFTERGRIRARQIFVRTEGRSEEAARVRAETATRRLRAGEAFDVVRGELGDEETAPIPDALLPASKLRDYVGETAMTTALARAAGETTDPVRSSMGFHVLQVTERTASAVPPFEEVVDRVRVERRRRADEATLRAALDQLRRAARVRTVEPLP
jgi:parvulin-like peptidyl-prolyl isomerase